MLITPLKFCSLTLPLPSPGIHMHTHIQAHVHTCTHEFTHIYPLTGVQWNQWVRMITFPVPPPFSWSLSRHQFLLGVPVTSTRTSKRKIYCTCKNNPLFKHRAKTSRKHQNPLHRQRVNIVSWNSCFCSESEQTTWQDKKLLLWFLIKMPDLGGYLWCLKSISFLFLNWYVTEVTQCQ